MIRCKRVYDQPEKSDGYRVLVDRLWPRGVAKADLPHDEWCKTVAPSSALRKAFHGEAIDFATFRKDYEKELDAQQEEVTRLKDIAKKQTLTLLYAAKGEDNHARVLADYLR